MKPIKAWAVTSKKTPLYWLGQGAYEKPDPYAIFRDPADAFKYFVHCSDFGDPTISIVPVTIEVPTPNPKHTYASISRTFRRSIASARSVSQAVACGTS